MRPYPTVNEGIIRRVLSALRRACRPRFTRRAVFTYHVQRALAVSPRRGAVANDGLQIHVLSARIQIEWTARFVHPWDRDLPQEERSALFVQQCLHDVDQAITQLFERFDIVDELDISVLNPGSKARILAGVVSRTDYLASRRLTTQMRLKMAGLAYEIGRGGLQPLR